MTEPREDASRYVAHYPDERRLHDAEAKLADARERLASLETEIRHRATKAWVLGLAPSRAWPSASSSPFANPHSSPQRGAQRQALSSPLSAARSAKRSPPRNLSPTTAFSHLYRRARAAHLARVRTAAAVDRSRSGR